jgi:hypothetical protein
MKLKCLSLLSKRSMRNEISKLPPQYQEPVIEIFAVAIGEV